jgi:hypothetical protein
MGKKGSGRKPSPKDGRGGVRRGAGRPPNDPSGAGVDVSLWLPKPLARWLTSSAKALKITRSEHAKRILQRAMKRDQERAARKTSAS